MSGIEFRGWISEFSDEDILAEVKRRGLSINVNTRGREMKMFDLRECCHCNKRESVMEINGERLCLECAESTMQQIQEQDIITEPLTEYYGICVERDRMYIRFGRFAGVDEMDDSTDALLYLNREDVMKLAAMIKKAVVTEASDREVKEIWEHNVG